MKTRLLLICLLSALLLNACSSRLIENDIPNEGEPSVSPGTKAPEPESDLSDEEICNILQTSCISMLINHVVLKEGVYIQSLTERDIESLGIGKSDVDYVNEYIKELNRIHNEKSN